MTIEIYPLEKVVIDGVPVSLGMEPSAVEAAIGKGQPVGKRHYYFNSEMAIDYRNGKVEYIEFLGGIDGALKPVIHGFSAFDAMADELVELLKKQNNGAIGDTECGHSYQFPNIGVGLYREAVPEEVAEMIAEAAGFGNPMSDEEIRYESRRAHHWAAIGIGAGDYFCAN